MIMESEKINYCIFEQQKPSNLSFTEVVNIYKEERDDKCNQTEFFFVSYQTQSIHILSS